MNAIRIRKRIDSETLHLPELRAMLGKEVEIIVLEETAVPTEEASEPSTTPETTPYDAFFDLAGKIDYDFDAYKKQRAFDVDDSA